MASEVSMENLTSRLQMCVTSQQSQVVSKFFSMQLRVDANGFQQGAFIQLKRTSTAMW